jgi:small ligand-binding sensory domain FIST
MQSNLPGRFIKDDPVAVLVIPDPNDVIPIGRPPGISGAEVSPIEAVESDIRDGGPFDIVNESVAPAAASSQGLGGEGIVVGVVCDEVQKSKDHESFSGLQG